MERIYFHARTVGRPQDVLQRIIAIVMNSDMASQIPLVKLERRAKGEFYVFLGVDSDHSYRIPGRLAETFRRNGLRFEEDYALQPNHIASMVQRQNIEIHGFNSLKYRPWAYDNPGDPFEQSDGWQPQKASSESCAVSSGYYTGFRLEARVHGRRSSRRARLLVYLMIGREPAQHSGG